jgi:hypothetical protein
MPYTFNRNQLATWEEARECATRLSTGPIVVGNGVKPESPNPAASGIYIPQWFGGPSAFPEPSAVDEATGKKYHFCHFRFNNGAEGMNVGLILDMFRRYPNSPSWVLGKLAEEAAELARN